MLGPNIRFTALLTGLFSVFACGVFYSISGVTAAPDTTSSWVKGLHSQVRLISGHPGPIAPPDRVFAGVHIKLEKGWKTYWRFPGDAGAPPHFNWTGSSNLKNAKIHWPSPRRLADPYGTSIGYLDEVVFPIHIEPKEVGKPVDLNLKFEYAVCKDICIPAEAKIKLKVLSRVTSTGAHGKLIAHYLARVPPEISAPPSKTSNGPTIRKITAQLEGKSPNLIIEAVFTDGAKNRDLFVEGPEQFYLPVPKRLDDGSQGIIRFRVDLSQGDNPKQLRGKSIKCTLVSDVGYAEIAWRVK